MTPAPDDDDAAEPVRRREVVIGLLGTVLDLQKAGLPERWEVWRPTVDLCRHEEFLVHRLDLLHEPRHAQQSQDLVEDLAAVSPETEVRLHPLAFRDPWDFEEVYTKLHDFAVAYPFEPELENYSIHLTTGTHVVQICLFLLTESHHLPGVLLQCQPPKRRRSASVGRLHRIDLDLSRYDRIAARFHAETTTALEFLKSGISTRNPSFNHLIERIERVALRSPEPLLLMGPTGAGKSRLARRIWELQRERELISGDFVEVNCATLRGDAALSTLFGHVKGSFTGATRDRDGLLRRADGGVLFLDEIGELGLDEQALLLRAIEEKRVLPVGADDEAATDFRLFAGTNRDLHTEVRRGRFREDLLARINLWTFRLPGLRERPEDIEPNLDFEIEEVERLTGQQTRFTRQARLRFLRFATSPEATWDANFRDLNAAVKRLTTLADRGRIDTRLIDEEIDRLQRSWLSRDVRSTLPPVDLRALLSSEHIKQLDLFDRLQLEAVVAVLRQCSSLSEAGRKLFAVSRTQKSKPNDSDRLRKYLARFGLDWKALTDQDSA